MVLRLTHNPVFAVRPIAIGAKWPNTLRRSGFTLVELLAVLGIIILLVGIVFVALNVVYNNAATSQTRVALDTAHGLLVEYETINPLKNAPYYSASVDSTATLPLPLPDPKYSLTGVAMADLLKVPANRSAVEKMASNTIASVTAEYPLGVGAVSYTHPVPLDGWAKPILFVGTGGLTKVTRTGVTGVSTITAPTNRPFWVSAGPDGLFNTHDDNVYSFEN